MRKELHFRLAFDESPDLPQGVEDALFFLKPGDRAVVDVSGQYGFGSVGRADLGIPANASLTYDITVMSCEPVSRLLFSVNGKKT